VATLVRGLYPFIHERLYLWLHDSRSPWARPRRILILRISDYNLVTAFRLVA